jgi:acetyl esterase/lipase
MTTHTGIGYAEIDGFRPLVLDLHVPDGVDHPPVVVWIHGGAFMSGDRRYLPWTYPPESVWASLNAAGIACATVDYRLTGEAGWPAQRDDIAAAIAFLRSRADTYGIDAARIATWGESAGGHLALMAGLGDPTIRCIVAYYPLTDIVALGQDPGAELEVYQFGSQPPLTPDVARDASPINHITAASPPCLFVHGDADRLLPLAQSVSMHERLIEAGVHSTLRVVPGGDHCFDGYADVPGLIDEAVAYLRDHLAG